MMTQLAVENQHLLDMTDDMKDFILKLLNAVKHDAIVFQQNVNFSDVILEFMRQKKFPLDMFACTFNRLLVKLEKKNAITHKEKEEALKTLFDYSNLMNNYMKMRVFKSFEFFNGDTTPKDVEFKALTSEDKKLFLAQRHIMLELASHHALTHTSILGDLKWIYLSLCPTFTDVQESLRCFRDNVIENLVDDFTSIRKANSKKCPICAKSLFNCECELKDGSHLDDYDPKKDNCGNTGFKVSKLEEVDYSFRSDSETLDDFLNMTGVSMEMPEITKPKSKK